MLYRERRRSDTLDAGDARITTIRWASVAVRFDIVRPQMQCVGISLKELGEAREGIRCRNV